MEKPRHRLSQQWSSFQQTLDEIWVEIGITDQDKENKLKEYQSKIVDKESRIRNDYFRRIEHIGSKVCQLTKDLSLEDVKPELDYSLIQLEKFLNEKHIELQRIAKDRINEFDSLREKEKMLCCKLMEDLSELRNENVPSKKTIQNLECVVNKLKEKCEQRDERFKRFRFAISNYMDELDSRPTTHFERMALGELDEPFPLTEINLNKLEHLCKDLQAKLQVNKEKEKELEAEINLLWERLSVDQEDREFFLSSLTDNSTKNIPKLEEKLEELKQIRHSNLGYFIHQLRRELEQWLQKCFISDDEIHNFSPYSSDNYTEDMLELLEQEVKRLRTYYSENEIIFKKVEAWQQLWQKVSDLEEKANDPNRLFGNRGCSLLLEEKERKKVNAELPKLVKDLEKRIAVWEVEKGKPFLVCGKTLKNYMQFQLENFTANKRKMKEERQVARSKQLHKDAQFGSKKSPVKRINPSRAETLRTSKYQKLTHHTKMPGAGCVSTYGASLSRCSSRNNLQLLKTSHTTKDFLRDQSIQVGPHTGNITMGLSDSTVMSSYDKFTEEIHSRVHERENFRSSVVPCAKEGKSPRPRNGSSTPKEMPQTLPVRGRPPRQPLSNFNKQTFTPTSSRVTNQSRLNVKTPMTLPRRRSSRLENFRQANCGSSRISPSPLTKSRYAPFNSTKLVSPIRNKLIFLM